jgi:hypothetical protein
MKSEWNDENADDISLAMEQARQIIEKQRKEILSLHTEIKRLKDIPNQQWGEAVIAYNKAKIEINVLTFSLSTSVRNKIIEQLKTIPQAYERKE